MIPAETLQAYEAMLRELRRLGCNRGEPCGVHAEPQWTCGFCLHNVLAVFEALASEPSAICKTCGQSFSLSAEHACPGLLPRRAGPSAIAISQQKSEPSAPPVQPNGRFLLNAYGRECWEFGYAAGKRDANEQRCDSGVDHGSGSNHLPAGDQGERGRVGLVETSVAAPSVPGGEALREIAGVIAGGDSEDNEHYYVTVDCGPWRHVPSELLTMTTRVVIRATDGRSTDGR